MTGMEHAIEQAARAIHAGHCCPCDLRGCYEPDAEDYNAARALASAGLLAPAPLTEEWAAIDDNGDVRMRYGADSHSPHREFGTSWTYSRWVTDWKGWGE